MNSYHKGHTEVSNKGHAEVKQLSCKYAAKKKKKSNIEAEIEFSMKIFHFIDHHRSSDRFFNQNVLLSHRVTRLSVETFDVWTFGGY